jgi:flagellar hook-associated protein 2
MTSITSMGIGSGLDINGLLGKLMAAESEAPTKRLDRQEAQLQAKLSAHGTLKGALVDFQGALTGLRSLSALQGRTATSSNTAVFTATAFSNATAGTHSITVTKLAQTHKLASEAFNDTTAAMGTGVLTFEFGTFSGGTFAPNADKTTQTVSINAANNSLQGIRDAVNNAHIGVTVSLVNDGTGYRLVFSSADSGAANSLRVTVSDGDGNHVDSAGLSQLAYDPLGVLGSGKNLSETMEARDAELEVDGLPIKSASNTVTGAIAGITLNLLDDPATGNAGTLTVAQDRGRVTSAVEGFVSKYNSLVETFNTLSNYDPETQRAGILLGDATVRGMASQSRRVLGEAVQGLSGPFRSLADIGITTNSDGTLTLDSDKLAAALDAGFDNVGRIFAAGGRPSDSLLRYVSSTSATPAGQYAVEITQLATQGSYAGGTVPGISFPLITNTDNDTFAIKVDGVQSSTISLTQGTYASGADLAVEIQSRINGDSALDAAGASVSVSYDSDNSRFVITSTRYGSASTVELTAVDTASATTLGFLVGAGTAGLDVAGTIGGAAAKGSGRILTGTENAAGLAIEVLGGSTGARGTVEFSRGIADRLDTLISGFLDSDGTIETATEALNARIEDIGEQREALSARLAAVEERYRSQFTALDMLLGRMRATSDYLTQQLEMLPGAGGED